MTPSLQRKLYWFTLVPFALMMTLSGVMDIAHPPELAAGMQHLGYPLYFVTILGVWKLLGVSAVSVRGLPRLKEWAYAGFAFDLSGAFVSHLASGDGLAKASLPLVFLMLGMGSWALRPASRRLA